MRKIVVFDVDGVLIDTEIGSFKDLGVLLGKEDEIKKHHEEYERKKHLGPWGLEELALIFKGIEEEKVRSLAKRIVKERLMQGVEETLSELKRRGYILLSYSSSPIWIMDTLKERFGFDDVCGNIVEIKNKRITGRLLEKVDRYVKAEKFYRKKSNFKR